MLEGVAKCRRDYEPFIVNLERLHDKRVSRSCPRSAAVTPTPAPPSTSPGWVPAPPCAHGTDGSRIGSLGRRQIRVLQTWAVLQEEGEGP